MIILIFSSLIIWNPNAMTKIVSILSKNNAIFKNSNYSSEIFVLFPFFLHSPVIFSSLLLIQKKTMPLHLIKSSLHF